MAMNLYSQGSIPSSTWRTWMPSSPPWGLYPDCPAPAPPLCRRAGLHGVFRQPPGRHPQVAGGGEAGSLLGRGLPAHRSCRSRSQLRGSDPHQQSVRQGGVTYLLERDLGLQLPRWLQIDFSRRVQAEAEACSSEISPEQIRTLFERHYLEPAHGYRIGRFQLGRDSQESLRLELQTPTGSLQLSGEGRGHHGAGQRLAAPDRDAHRRAGLLGTCLKRRYRVSRGGLCAAERRRDPHLRGGHRPRRGQRLPAGGDQWRRPDRGAAPERLIPAPYRPFAALATQAGAPSLMASAPSQSSTMPCLSASGYPLRGPDASSTRKHSCLISSSVVIIWPRCWPPCCWPPVPVNPSVRAMPASLAAPPSPGRPSPSPPRCPRPRSPGARQHAVTHRAAAARTVDRNGWAQDIVTALAKQDLAVTDENVCPCWRWRSRSPPFRPTPWCRALARSPGRRSTPAPASC